MREHPGGEYQWETYLKELAISSNRIEYLWGVFGGEIKL